MADISTAPLRAPASTGPLTGAAYDARTPTSVIEKRLELRVGTKLLYYPLETPKYFLRLKVSEYSRRSLMKLGTLSDVANIVLPLPMQLIDAHNVIYEDKALGTLIGGAISGFTPGRLTANEATATTRLSDLAKGAGLAGAGAALGALAGGLLGSLGAGKTGAAAGAAAGAALGTSRGIDAARAFLGVAANQFITILMQGPTYKRYEFGWRFSPRTAKEAERLRAIVQAMNNYMSPGLAYGGAIFTFPKIFHLSLYPNSKYLFKFKPAVLESFSCNYTPGNQAAFYKAHGDTGGLNAPEGLDMAMRFIEIEYWLDGDFNDNNDPYDVEFKGSGSGSATPSLPATPTPVTPGVPGSGFNPGSATP